MGCTRSGAHDAGHPMRCTLCGARDRRHAMRCTRGGAHDGVHVMWCTRCGARNVVHAMRCTRCGARDAPPREQQRACLAKARREVHRTQGPRRRMSSSERTEPEPSEACTARKSHAARAATSAPRHGPARMHCTQESRRRASSSARAEPEPSERCPARKSHAAARAAAGVPGQSPARRVPRVRVTPHEQQ